jgi:hypothetical protein
MAWLDELLPVDELPLLTGATRCHGRATHICLRRPRLTCKQHSTAREAGAYWGCSRGALVNMPCCSLQCITSTSYMYGHLLGNYWAGHQQASPSGVHLTWRHDTPLCSSSIFSTLSTSAATLASACRVFCASASTASSTISRYA